MLQPDPQLEAAYRATTYVVDAPGNTVELCIGAHNPACDALLRAHAQTSAAFLTAWNPRSRPLPLAENERRQARLLRCLTAGRRSFFRGRGRGADPGWSPEESVLVLGLEREAALTLARCFEQHALVFVRAGEAPELLWC